MRFLLGNAPETDKQPDETEWTKVSMPEVHRWQLMAFPVALVNMVIVAGLWLLLTPAADGIRSVHFPLPVIGFVVCLLGVLIVHEFIHSWAHPKVGFSRNSTIGFFPSRMLLYCVYNGDVSRTRFLVILAMPFVCISLIPMLISAATHTFSFWLAYVTILNAFVSAGDALEIATVVRKVPRSATIRRNGWGYCWKVGV